MMDIERIEDEIRFDAESLTDSYTTTTQSHSRIHDYPVRSAEPLPSTSTTSVPLPLRYRERDRDRHGGHRSSLLLLHSHSTDSADQYREHHHHRRRRSHSPTTFLSSSPQIQPAPPATQSRSLVDDEDFQDTYTPSALQPEPVIVRGNGNLTVFGLNNRFSTDFPQPLQARLAPEEFAGTIERVNSLLSKALPLQLKWVLFGCLCCCCTLGCSLWPVICLSKKTRLGIEKLLDWENSHLYNRLGLRWKLAQMHADSSSMLEYVLVIEFVPKKYLYKPD